MPASCSGSWRMLITRLIPRLRFMHWTLLRTVAHNEDGAVCVGHAVLAYRSQQHASEFTVTAAANDQQVRSVGSLDQQGGRVTLEDCLLNGNASMGLPKLARARR